MEKRVLAVFLGLAHFMICVFVIGALLAVSAIARDLIAIRGPVPALFSSFTWVVVVVGALAIFAWDVSIQVVALVFVVRRASHEAMEGRFSAASERLRRLLDREVVLRIAGLSGAVWKQAHVIEAYNDYLHGLAHEAIEVASAEALGGIPFLAIRSRRMAASVVAAASAETADAASFERIHPWVERAWRTPRNADSQAFLGAEGILFVQTLALSKAEERASQMLAADPKSRMGFTVRANVRIAQGRFEEALADLATVATLSPPRRSGAPLQGLLTQLNAAARAGCMAELGRLDEAVAIAKGIQAEGPRHRHAAFAAASHPALAAAKAGDVAGAREGLARLHELALRYSFEPILRARCAIVIARVERTLGEPQRALGVLSDAIGCSLPLLRQEGLVEQARARKAAGDAAGAEASLGWAREISAETRYGRLESV